MPLINDDSMRPQFPLNVGEGRHRHRFLADHKALTGRSALDSEGLASAALGLSAFR
ncbi:hypothetical protein [Bradyrhizobium sp. CCBAU 51765]|uniref:hypothetical protein n=1 Tax=Bradyrhizobium sp. CCBAU 51765 TaxID=1325102 RepID=UPI001FEFF756|nr:hypothetical protein [Bradyrhizobium sp. CCBAU 51765]